MALDKASLASAIEAVLDYAETAGSAQNADKATVKKAIAQKLADAIDAYTSQAEVKFAPNEIAVTTNGSATSQSGGNPAPITKKVV